MTSIVAEAAAAEGHCQAPVPAQAAPSRRVPEQPPKGGLKLNAIANATNFAVNLLVGLWFTPYLVHNLGVAAYGLVPLAMNLSVYLGLFTTVINGGVGRFLTIALERNDQKLAHQVFNTAVAGSALAALVLAVPAAYLSWHGDRFFNVPTGYERQFALLLMGAVAMCLLGSVSAAFSVSSFSRNRLELSNGVLILASLGRVAVVVLLFEAYRPQVWHVGVGMASAGVLTLVGSVAVWRYLTPMLRIRPGYISWKAFRELSSVGGWMAINQLGAIMFVFIDLVVINRMLGAEAGGRYGALMQWSALLRAMGGTVAAVFAPTIVAMYAQQNVLGLVCYARAAVKFSGLLLALPIGLVCGLAGPLLGLWLGKSFQPLAPLMSLMTIHLSANLCIVPLFHIQVATNRVRTPGLVTCLMGAMNLGLAVLLAGPVGWGMYGVAAAGAIMLTAKNLIFTPLYGAHVLGLKPLVFFREAVVITAVTVGLAAAALGLSQVWALQSWWSLIAAGLVLSLFYVVFVSLVILSRSERMAVLRLVTPRLAGGR